MYPAGIKIKDTTESATSAPYLDLPLSIGREGQLYNSIYDKRDKFNFHAINFPSWVASFYRHQPSCFMSQRYNICSGLFLIWLFYSEV